MSESQPVLYHSQRLSQPNLSSLRNCNGILEGVEAFGGSHGIQAAEHGQHSVAQESAFLRLHAHFLVTLQMFILERHVLGIFWEGQRFTLRD